MMTEILCVFGRHEYGPWIENDKEHPPVHTQTCLRCGKQKIWMSSKHV